ncbi:MAG: alpha/beta fold hydrolase [Planctomycetota bacterium]
MSLAGHFWTVVPTVSGYLAPPRLPRPTPWETTVHDPLRGPVRLTGDLHERADAKGLVVVIPGLGGNTRSPYARRAARDLLRCGWSALLMPQRGGDLRGEDYYHASLSADLHAAVGSPAVRRYQRVCCLGFSMGGHVTLRFAADPPPAHVVAVAAICSPIDLFAAQRFFDQSSRWLYRWHVLRALKKIYREVHARGLAPTPLPDLMSARSIRDWDTMAIVPRFDFRDANDYYARASVAPHLHALAVPSLLLLSTQDPIISAEDVRRAMPDRTPNLNVEWHASGGHVSFPRRFGLIDRVDHWFERAVERTRDDTSRAS